MDLISGSENLNNQQTTEYVSGSDSDLDDNPLENDELDSETANDSVFHHVNTNFVTRSGRKVGIPKEYMYGQLVSEC